MNSENFHEYVKNPSMLHQVSYQELKSLVLQYPYSPNLRYLLLLKSLFEQSKDFDKNQVFASLSSPDRKKLRQMVKQYSRLREIQENYALNEDFLELKDLSILEKLIDGQSMEAAMEQGLNEATALPPTAGAVRNEQLEEEPDLGFLENLGGNVKNSAGPEPAVWNAEAEQEIPEAASDASVEDSWDLHEIIGQAAPSPEGSALEPDVDNQGSPEADALPDQSAAGKAKEIPLEITNEPLAQPMPRSSFNSWLKQFNPPQAGILKTDLRDISLNSKQLQPPAEEKETSVKQMVDQSVEEDEEIISETLALLLEKQKFYGKAIAMYERLGLLFPQKSSLFAAKIEELIKKL